MKILSKENILSIMLIVVFVANYYLLPNAKYHDLCKYTNFILLLPIIILNLNYAKEVTKKHVKYTHYGISLICTLVGLYFLVVY